MASSRPLFFLGLISLLSLAQAQTPYTLSTQPDAAWTNLFDRTVTGWTGADGIFAIPLSGYEGPGRASQTKILFVFSDTFIGSVNAQTGARQNASFIHNSLAILDGGLPDSSRIRFIWGGTGTPQTIYTPSTPRANAYPGSWYWLQDGFLHSGNVYLFTILVSPNPSGPPGFQFQENGVTMIKIPLGTNGEPDVARHTQFDTPLFHRSGTTTLFFGGAGIMPNTVAAGAHTPDGYLYMYGRLQGNLAVARILPAQIEDSTQWRYWNGSAWSTSIASAASLGGPGGAELSVTPVPDGPLAGKYLMCSAPLNGDVFIRVGDSPVGPFAARVNIYRPTESSAGQGIYTYNAKVHPSISASGSDLLVTYNVNTTDWNVNLGNADIYRPRFLHLRITPTTAILPHKRPRNADLFPLNGAIFAPQGRNAVGRRIPARETR